MDRRAGAWAASGAMALTGRADGPPLGAPGALVDLVERASATIAARSGVQLDGMALLGERAAIEGLQRNGDVSCGGGTRLVRAADGWLAVAFPRDDDVAALPAWLERAVPPDDPWPAVIDAAASTPAGALDERAALLGLPIAPVGSVPAPGTGPFGLPVDGARLRAHERGPLPIAGVRVVDLSSLWAGPLCGQLLVEAGADVVKVESATRPDGARHGSPTFFRLLNGGKQSVVVDLSRDDGRRDLARLVASADVVIESARPRALEQLGIVAADVVRAPGGPHAWVSITGQGRSRPERVAFGDVAAAAGGLVTCDGNGPCFVADAVADPLAGLVAAAAVLDALAAGGTWLLDVGLAPVAASVAGAPLDVARVAAAPPRARTASREAAGFGEHTDDVLAALRA